jgi:hypothetical protein
MEIPGGGRSLNAVIILRQQMRQSDDSRYATLLKNLRIRQPTQEDIQLLNTRIGITLPNQHYIPTIVRAQKNGNASENSNDKTTTDEENVMHVDSKNGDTNGISANERREMFEDIVASVSTCFERQGDQEQIWLKEWFAMVARKYSSDVDGLEGTGWFGEILNDAAEFRKRIL